MKYIILSLDDAKTIAKCLPDGPIKSRLENEEGADIVDIKDQLQRMEFCPACEIEGQQRTCAVLQANKLGRRLRRLIERADQ